MSNTIKWIAVILAIILLVVIPDLIENTRLRAKKDAITDVYTVMEWMDAFGFENLINKSLNPIEKVFLSTKGLRESDVQVGGIYVMESEGHHVLVSDPSWEFAESASTGAMSCSNLNDWAYSPTNGTFSNGDIVKCKKQWINATLVRDDVFETIWTNLIGSDERKGGFISIGLDQEEPSERISSLPSIRGFTAVGCGIAKIKSFGSVSRLQELNLSANSISEFPDLSNLPLLRRCSLSRNHLESIGFLNGVERLDYLNLSFNPISDLSPILAVESWGEEGLVFLYGLENSKNFRWVIEQLRWSGVEVRW